jgi:hypothetical protein
MFKLRRRAGAAVTGSDQPYCPMCQQPIRIDAATGRCALGHRAVAPAADPLGAEPLAVGEATDVLEPVAVAADAPQTHDSDGYDAQVYDPEAFDPYDTIVYGRSDFGSDAPATWEASAESGAGGLEEYATWGEPADGPSSLDVDTQPLPPVPAPETAGSPGNGLFDPIDDREDNTADVDDATHARRKAVGTVAGTLGVSGLVFAAIAALPF